MVKKVKKKWPIQIPLKHPITVSVGEDNDKVELKELSLKQMKAKHLKYMPVEMESAYFIVPLISKLTDISEEEAGELDMEDLLSVSEKLLPFLEKLQGTGKR